MKTTQKQKIKYTGVVIDPLLNKYENVVLFPKKLALANQRLKKSGFPGITSKHT